MNPERFFKTDTLGRWKSYGHKEPEHPTAVGGMPRLVFDAMVSGCFFHILGFWPAVALLHFEHDHVPSDRVLNPDMSMAEKWTKMSRPSCSLIKPYPFLSLNHFTVPFAKALTSSSQ
jgi:hypothetical protein